MGRVDIIRKSMADYIAQNPTTVTVFERPLIDNGYGYKVPDINEDGEEVELGTLRVTRRDQTKVYVTGTETPYDYNDVYYALAEYDADWLQKGLVFTCIDGKRYRTGEVENRMIFGEIAYKVSQLEDTTYANVGSHYIGS